MQEEKRMKSLIINIDDVGISPAINEAVKKCYSLEVISGVSVVSCGTHFFEACNMLEKIDKKEVGAHLTLTGGLLPCTKDLAKVRNLLGRKETFLPTYKELIPLYLKKKLNLEEVYLEFASQIKKLKEEGLVVTHLDSHEHIHMLPGIMKITLALAKEFKVPYVRLSKEPAYLMIKKFRPKDLARQTSLKVVTKTAKNLISEEGLKCNDAFLGHFHSGRIDNDILRFMMERLRDGVSELAVHPGVLSPELLDFSAWYRNAQKELDALTTGNWRDCLTSGAVRLISHKEVS